MICVYCQQECEAYQDVNTSFPAWNCRNHPMLVQFLEVEPEDQWACTYAVYYRDTLLYVEVYNFPRSQQWILREGSKTVIQFDYLPKLTPDNINHRIATLIVFS